MKGLKKAFFLLLTVAGLLVFVFFQNYTIEQELCTVISNIPDSFQGFRILQLSDLHGRLFGADSKALLTAVQRTAPNIICITGDLFDENTDLTILPPLLQGLCRIAPTYYVTGNHEWQLPDLQKILSQMEDLGVHVLKNEWEFIEFGGGSIVIAGVHDPCGPYDQKNPQELIEEIRLAAGDAFVLMLCHRNDTLNLWASLGADLVLTGHCHGGIMRLPFVGGLFGSNRELLPEYDAGLYKKENTQLYVSRGLGYSRLPIRLFNRPEVSLLILENVNNS